jgi:hypothetical protein
VVTVTDLSSCLALGIALLACTPKPDAPPHLWVPTFPGARTHTDSLYALDVNSVRPAGDADSYRVLVRGESTNPATGNTWTRTVTVNCRTGMQTDETGTQNLRPLVDAYCAVILGVRR